MTEARARLRCHGLLFSGRLRSPSGPPEEGGALGMEPQISLCSLRRLAPRGQGREAGPAGGQRAGRGRELWARTSGHAGVRGSEPGGTWGCADPVDTRPLWSQAAAAGPCFLPPRVQPGRQGGAVVPRVHWRRPLHRPPCARAHVLPTKPTAQATLLDRQPGRVQPFMEVCPRRTLVTEAWTSREGRATRALN